MILFDFGSLLVELIFARFEELRFRLAFKILTQK